jgi:DNA-binding response OmpR family regulator
MPRIAILEDDPAQAELLSRWLRDAGHGCVLFETGRSLMQNAFRDSYDLFLLDWRTPQGSGDEVLAWIREHVSTSVPVLFATAMNDEKSIVHALDSGADDYLVKPLRQAELLARVRTLLRRAGGRESAATSIVAGAYVVDPEQRTVSIHGKAVELTPKEFSLALLLFQNVGRILSRGYILQAIWGQTEDLHTRRVDTHISQIRQKLKLHAANGVRLVAIYQHGYRLELTAPRGEAALPLDATPPTLRGEPR